MGKLTKAKLRRQARRLGRKLLTRRTALNWALPLLVTIIALFAVHARVQANPAPPADELATYLQTHELQVATDGVDGYEQVYYIYNGDKVFITSAPYNHTHPHANGEYVVWTGIINGSGQIFLYDVITQALTQLTSASANQDAAIYGNLVVWDTWENEHWQLYYYDGLVINQLTNGTDMFIRPDVYKTQIAFVDKHDDVWSVYVYDTATQQTTLMHDGDESQAWPHFVNGELHYTFGS